MSEPRRHHYVPQGFLRRFADADDRLRAIRRDGSGTFVTDVANLAVERDFYSIETEEGWTQAAELGLAEIEGHALAAIERVTAGEFPPRGEDRVSIGYFVALQWQRGRNMRDGWERAEEGIMRFMMRTLPTPAYHRFFRERYGRDATEKEIAGIRAVFNDPARLKIKHHQNRSIALLFKMLDGLARLALGRKWLLVRAPDAALLTSDAPVVLFAKNRGAPLGMSFGTADEIRISLDRRHALAMLWDSPIGERVVPGNERFVPEMNELTARNGYRFYFQHPLDAPLSAPLPPPRLPFASSGDAT